MTTSETLGTFQQLVMLAALRLGAEAHGASIQEELERTVGRTVAISTVYVTMERLEKRGLVRSHLGDPTPVRGGRAKRLYTLTDEGVGLLRSQRDEFDRMWDGVDGEVPLEGR